MTGAWLTTACGGGKEQSLSHGALHEPPESVVHTITGPYTFRPDLPADAQHTRTTTWLKTDIPRSKFDQDLLYTLGAFLTVCQVKRNNAEERIKAIVAGKAQTVALYRAESRHDPRDGEDTTVV